MPQNICIACRHARNQYGEPFTQPQDAAYCDVVPHMVTGLPAACDDVRRPDVAAGRCGEAGSLFVARAVEINAEG